jgi:hypothetical protein
MHQTEQLLKDKIAEFKEKHGKSPTRLILTWRARVDLEMCQALPDMEIVNSLTEYPAIKVE